MTTTVVKTIGSGGDYATIALWEASAPANLVTSDQVWQGQLISAATNLTETTPTIAGSTSDATRYKELTAAAGASFIDNASVQSNALRANTSNGCSLNCGDNYSDGLTVTENYFRMSRLQILGGGNNTNMVNISSLGVVVDKCIFDGKNPLNNPASSDSTQNIFKNCLFVQRRTGRPSIVTVDLSAAFYNCTFAAPSDLAAAPTDGIRVRYANLTTIVQNCAIFGAANAGPSSNITYTTCYTDDATPPTGCTTATYGSQFQNTLDATRDFRAKAAANILDTGTTDSTHAATDIVGTARPSGSAYDVGAWELVQAGGGGVVGSNFYRLVAGNGG